MLCKYHYLFHLLCLEQVQPRHLWSFCFVSLGPTFDASIWVKQIQIWFFVVCLCNCRLSSCLCTCAMIVCVGAWMERWWLELVVHILWRIVVATYNQTYLCAIVRKRNNVRIFGNNSCCYETQWHFIESMSFTHLLQ
jgi:hypothetical protein